MTDDIDARPPTSRLIDPPVEGTLEEIDAALVEFRELAEKYPLDYGPVVEELEDARALRVRFNARLAALKEAEARMTPDAGGIDGQTQKD